MYNKRKVFRSQIYMKEYKSKEEIKQMLSIKKIFDPWNILNPGKIF